MENETAFDRLPDSLKNILRSTSEKWHKIGYSEGVAHCVNALIEKKYSIEEIKHLLNLPEKQIHDLQNSFQIANK